MQAVILAGGMQSTLNTEESIPKPMIDIGGKPLLWHIMKHFSRHGIRDFLICGGYRIEVIKDYFKDYYIHASDITIDLKNNLVEIHKKETEDWSVTVVHTGRNTAALQRIWKAETYLKDEFLLTSGDCLSDIDYGKMIEQYRESGKAASIALVKPGGRKRLISLNESGIPDVNPVDEVHNGWINGETYILKKNLKAIIGEGSLSDDSLLQRLTGKEEAVFYKHGGFWTTIETMRDLKTAENLWEKNVAPWVGPGQV